MKLRNMLKLLLEQLTSPLTYVIEDEVMKITTVEKANEKLTIRMYPVGDLVFGPKQLQQMRSEAAAAWAGGGGGRRRRWHGRRWHGGGGMGGGGMGGGMGGGGMFSVPAEVFPAQSTSAVEQPALVVVHKRLCPVQQKKTDERALIPANQGKSGTEAKTANDRLE